MKCVLCLTDQNWISNLPSNLLSWNRIWIVIINIAVIMIIKIWSSLSLSASVDHDHHQFLWYYKFLHICVTYPFICLYRCYLETASLVRKLFILHLLDVWLSMFSGDIFKRKRDFSFKNAKVQFAQDLHAHGNSQTIKAYWSSKN